MSTIVVDKARPVITTPPRDETIEIDLQEEFDDPQGRFENYFAYTSLNEVQSKHHIDIRTFYQDDITIPTTMLFLDSSLMQRLNLRTMDDMADPIAVERGEQWTGGAVAKQPDFNNRRGITISCTAGSVSTASSVMV